MVSGAEGRKGKSTIGRAAVSFTVAAMVLLAQPAPVADESASDPLSLSPEMKSWVHSAVPGGGKAKVRLRRLMVELDRLGLEETSGPTRTAAEAFRTRKVDCVGYAHLFVALARELGVPVYFVLSEHEGRDRFHESYLTFISHMAVGLGSPRHPTLYDFGGESTPDRGRFDRIADSTAAAVLFSNRGVDQLLSGRPEAAVQRLRLATRLDPELTTAWTNLGVALRRLGDHAGAEAAYRRAIASDPESLPAWRNLAILLSRTSK